MVKLNHFIRRWPRAKRKERDWARRLKEYKAGAATVSTERFWLLMCKAGFKRYGLYHGVLESQWYHVEIPPEHTSVIEASLDETFEFLGFKRGWLGKLFHI